MSRGLFANQGVDVWQVACNSGKECQKLLIVVAALTGLVSALVNAMCVVLQTHPDRDALLKTWDAVDRESFAPRWMAAISQRASKGMTVAFRDRIREGAPALPLGN